LISTIVKNKMMRTKKKMMMILRKLIRISGALAVKSLVTHLQNAPEILISGLNKILLLNSIESIKSRK
jgi:hypothetical protein